MYSPSDRAINISYAIRELILKAKEIEKKEGIKVLKLASGDPAKYDFNPPIEFKEAIKEIMDGNFDINSYGDVTGNELLKDQLIRLERLKKNTIICSEDIFVTNGSIEAISALILALFKIGDTILLPDPYYPPYNAMARVYGLKVLTYPLDEDNGWSIDIDKLRYIVERNKEKFKAIVVINPNNPTGSVLSSNIIREILSIAGEYGIIPIFDEVYDQLYFSNFISVSAIWRAFKIPTFVINSLSKTFVVPGWRIGYVYKLDEESKLAEVWEALRKVLMLRISGPRITQIGAAIALKKMLDQGTYHDYIRAYREKLNERRLFMMSLLDNMDALDYEKPKGAFYIFPRIKKIEGYGNDRKFVLRLLQDEKILIVYGSAFGSLGKNHIRLVFLPPKDMIELALSKIASLLGEK